MSYGEAAKARRLRGMILKVLQTNHDERKSNFDSAALASAVVRGLGFNASPYEVDTTLEDLCGRGYVTYREIKNKKTFEVLIVDLKLTPRGRDLLEETTVDLAVEI